MAELTVRISEAAHEALDRMAAQTGESPQVILERAVEEYRRKRFLEAANASYAALRADPEAWAEELAERRSMEGTLMDGLREDAEDARQQPHSDTERMP